MTKKEKQFKVVLVHSPSSNAEKRIKQAFEMLLKDEDLYTNPRDKD